jgi:WD40 repeat protein
MASSLSPLVCALALTVLGLLTTSTTTAILTDRRSTCIATSNRLQSYPIIARLSITPSNTTNDTTKTYVNANTVDVAQGGNFVASVIDDAVINLWNVTDPSNVTFRQLSLAVSNEDSGFFVAFSSNSSLLYAAGGEHIAAFDVETGKLVRSFFVPNANNLIRAVAVPPPGHVNTSLLATSAGDHWIRIFDMDTGTFRVCFSDTCALSPS